VSIPSSSRLNSLDQFRGYTVLGMLLVNFLGSFSLCPRILRHTHDYCSYADTIMPQFLFAAGFAMQMGWQRLSQWERTARWRRIARRFIGLSLLAIAWYSLCDWSGIAERLSSQPWGTVLAGLSKRTWFQTLLHIAVTTLWIYPVIGRDLRIRAIWAAASGLLHVALSWAFNFEWVNTGPNGIDGGPLGFLTWSIPALAGTVACDWCQRTPEQSVRRLVVAGLLVGSAGFLMSIGTTLYEVPAESQPAEKLAVDPVVPSADRLKNWHFPELPFAPPPPSEQRQWNYWMMSQRAGTLSYCTFSAGISLLVYALFVWGCDRRGWQFAVFRTFGTNALAAYILHEVVGWLVDPFVTRESSALATLTAFGVFLLMTYAICRFLEWRQWYLRL
jgi:predicted acyltransferase